MLLAPVSVPESPNTDSGVPSSGYWAETQGCGSAERLRGTAQPVCSALGVLG